jgi:hypothetical protein
MRRFLDSLEVQMATRLLGQSLVGKTSQEFKKLPSHVQTHAGA